MSTLTPIIERLKTVDYNEKRQFLELLLRAFSAAKGPVEPKEKEAILSYIYEAMPDYTRDVLAAKTYKEKDSIFICGDMLIRLMMHLCPGQEDVPPYELVKIHAFVKLMESQLTLEMALDKAFAGEWISKAQVEEILKILDGIEDEYHRGKFYAGLFRFKDHLAKMEPEAIAAVTDFMESDFNRYLNAAELSEDALANVEMMTDVCRYFPGKNLPAILERVLNLGNSHIGYYALSTLLFLKEQVTAQTVLPLAQDLGFADLTYKLLQQYGKTDLFPKALATPENLAKSDMVHWLTYPTELGKQPDEIEYLGKITYLFKKEVYHVFRYRSGSDNLSDELKNKWLIGWSSEDGGTFSNFDLYEKFAGSNTKSTLRNIKRKLIG